MPFSPPCPLIDPIPKPGYVKEDFMHVIVTTLFANHLPSLANVVGHVITTPSPIVYRRIVILA